MASPATLLTPNLGAFQGNRVAMAAARDLIETEGALSRFWPTSELSRLNQDLGEWRSVSPRLYAALAASRRAQRRTSGLFDPTVLRSLESIGYRGAEVPPTEAETADGPWAEFRPRGRQVRLWRPVDLGGIGKGLGVRWAAQRVRAITETFLLNVGGDMMLEGDGPDREGWVVGVEDPRKASQMIATLSARGPLACCTSSIARKRWTVNGREVHHLIDPRTGLSGGEGLLAVTILAADPAWAEVASKALFLVGDRAISEAAGRLRALWVTRDGNLHSSPLMAPYISWTKS